MKQLIYNKKNSFKIYEKTRNAYKFRLNYCLEKSSYISTRKEDKKKKVADH